jgi:hypothetical protein
MDRMEELKENWPEYECRSVPHFSPISCSECGTPTQRFYYIEHVEQGVLSYLWFGMCGGCEHTRDQTLRDLYE